MSNNFVSSDLITTNSMRNFASDNDGDGWPILLYNLKHDFDLSDISRHYYPSRLSSGGQRTMEKILHWKIPSDMSHSYRHPQHKIFHALSVISSVDYRSVDFLDRLKCRGNLLIPTIAVFFFNLTFESYRIVAREIQFSARSSAKIYRSNCYFAQV